MDTTQLAQMVNWLDEQHRRDRSEIARLQQRLEAQTNDLQEQARRLQELEARLTNTATQLTRFGQIEQAQQNLRTEVTLLVQGQSDEVSKLQRDLERARMGDRETYVRGLDEVRKELGRIRAVEDELLIRRTEDQRLSELVVELRQNLIALTKNLEERTHALPFLNEQRNHDNKRIGQLQQENVELFKRVEEAGSKLQMLEQKQQKTESQVRTLPGMVDGMKKGQEQFVESLKLADADRQRQMRQWQQTMTEYITIVDASRKQVQEMAVLRDQVERTVSALDTFQDRIQREQSQVAELQRLQEERVRKEMDNFLGENDKRWKKQTLEWQFQWDQQHRVNVEVKDAFPDLIARLDLHDQLLQFLWRVFDGQSSSQLQAAQKWLQEVHKLAEQRQGILKTYEENKGAAR